MPTRSCLWLVSVVLFMNNGSSANPCCQTCESGKEKYYSIPTPSDTNPECGECCLQPSRYRFWKLFEPKLLKGDCVSLGFTEYKSTETDGIPPLAVTNDRYVRPNASRGCPSKLQAVFADMHDGDKKLINISGTSMTIKPSGNNQTWVVNTKLDVASCSASIDFNVPGKPNPPPVNLTASLWYAISTMKKKKAELEFTDPTGKLPAGPLNRWVQLEEDDAEGTQSCPTSLKAIYADMHDGDLKEVTISNMAMTIKPSGNNQTWVVQSHVNRKSCSAVIDFNVPGKPGPPPVNLTVTLWTTFAAADMRKRISEFEFTDPSGTLAVAGFPLNQWVEVKRDSDENDVLI